MARELRAESHAAAMAAAEDGPDVLVTTLVPLLVLIALFVWLSRRTEAAAAEWPPTKLARGRKVAVGICGVLFLLVAGQLVVRTVIRAAVDGRWWAATAASLSLLAMALVAIYLVRLIGPRW